LAWRSGPSMLNFTPIVAGVGHGRVHHRRGPHIPHLGRLRKWVYTGTPYFKIWLKSWFPWFFRPLPPHEQQYMSIILKFCAQEQSIGLLSCAIFGPDQLRGRVCANVPRFEASGPTGVRRCTHLTEILYEKAHQRSTFSQ